MTIETITKTTLDMLTVQSVSILKQEFAVINDVETQIGQNHRKAFVNSEKGRKAIAEYLTEPYLSSVMAVWGDTPVIVEDIEETEEE